MSLSVAIIGECMLELTHAVRENQGIARPMNMSYGGDSINTSVYLSRSGIEVSYVTALGDDLTSDWLLEEWNKEGINCSLVSRVPNAVPGMYMVNVADDGERSFLYWRKHSPASRIFDNNEYAVQLFQSLAHYDYLYLSGISLAILGSESRDRLMSLLDGYRQNGGKVIFDSNYRLRLWSSAEQAQQAYIRMYQLTDIALPTLDDEAALFGFASAEQVMQAIQDYGVPEIVVKMGCDDCLAYNDGVVTYVAAELVDPVDTTAAGDSFNAGYLANRLRGGNSIDACKAGHKLASKVVQYPGAIIPAEAAI